MPSKRSPGARRLDSLHPWAILVPVADRWVIFDWEDNASLARRMAYVAHAAFGESKMARPARTYSTITTLEQVQTPATRAVFTRAEINRVRERALFLPPCGPRRGTGARTIKAVAPGPGWRWDFQPLVRIYRQVSGMVSDTTRERSISMHNASAGTGEWFSIHLPIVLHQEVSQVMAARNLGAALYFARLYDLHQMAIMQCGSSPDILSLLEEADLLPVIA